MKILMAAVCLLALPTVAQALQPPTPAQLQENAAKDIGAYWSPTSFKIVAKQFNNNPLKPTFIARFQIAATNPKALYLPNGDKVGPEDVLVLTVPAKTARTFYGTVNLTYTVGAWAGSTKIENPASKLGKPLDLYTVPTLVLGSAQYKQAVGQLKVGLTTQQTVAAKIKLALATADSQKQLIALQEQIQAKQQAVAAPVKLAQATVDSQKQLISLQQQLLANDVTLTSLKTKLAEKQKVQLVSFEGTWSGTLRCKKIPGGGLLNWGIFATEVDLMLSKQTGGMLKGQLIAVGGDLGNPRDLYGKAGQLSEKKPIPATFQPVNDGDKKPLRMDILSAGRQPVEKTFMNFEVQLAPNGVLKGDLVHYPRRCSVVFSRG